MFRERDGKPMYSLIHASIRPEKWRATFDEWLSKCERPEDVEYILCVDAADAERFDVNRLPSSKGFTFRMVANHGRRCNVDAWNHAASVSEGHIIIAVSDDTGACEGWDSKVGLAIPRTPLGAAFVVNLRQEFIIDIFTGSPNGARCSKFRLYSLLLPLSTPGLLLFTRRTGACMQTPTCMNRRRAMA